MNFKGTVTLLIALAALAVGCAKQENHAPVCPYGQVLSYNQGTYTCAFVNMSATSYMGYNGYNNQQPVQQAPGMTQMVSPPVLNCGNTNQTLVNWNGTWLCYTNDVIYPPNDNSPGGVTPPPGRGGEFCTSVGMAGVTGMYGYNPYGTTASMGGSNMYVSCSPGFVCQSSGQTTSPNQIANPYGMSMYGQSGTCVFQGYHGSY
jgi:hypothetical protein